MIRIFVTGRPFKIYVDPIFVKEMYPGEIGEFCPNLT
jgi:hypothetical protein